MHCFHVTLYYRDEDDTIHFIGKGAFHADTKADAEECAMQTWWDHRLEAASCSPHFEVKELPFPWNLQAGDEVTWIDPDGGTSETIKILDISFHGKPDDSNGTISLTKQNGDVIECFASELSR